MPENSLNTAKIVTCSHKGVNGTEKVRFYWLFDNPNRVGSDTGSRGSSPLDFAEKTGFLLTFLHVELTTMQCSQNFDDLFFAHLKGEFNPHF